MVNAAHTISRISKGIHHDGIFVVAELLSNMTGDACNAREKIKVERGVKRRQDAIENLAYKERESM